MISFNMVKTFELAITKAAKLPEAAQEQLGRELLTAYLGSLKAKTEVKINQSALEKSSAK